MKVADKDVEETQSPFDFDTWRCPRCGFVVTIQEYTQAVLDFACVRCSLTKLSEYRLWPGASPEYITDQNSG